MSSFVHLIRVSHKIYMLESLLVWREILSYYRKYKERCKRTKTRPESLLQYLKDRYCVRVVAGSIHSARG